MSVPHNPLLLLGSRTVYGRRIQKVAVLNIRVVVTLLAAAAVTTGFVCSAWADQDSAIPSYNIGDAGRPAEPQPMPSPSLMEREKLTGDWGGARNWLKGHGITVNPRLTQFYQGMPVGDGAHGF
jgi:hypothetical protein